MRKVFPILTLILIFFTNCKKDNLADDVSDPNYPSKYCILDDGKRDLLAGKLISNTPNYFLIDSFGFLDRNMYQHPGSEMYIGKINNRDSVLKMAKNFIFKNLELCGVIDTSMLKVDRLFGQWTGFGETLIPDSVTDKNTWYIYYKEQEFEGLEVFRARMSIALYPKGVYQFSGHYYPDIYLPKTEQITFLEAKEKMVGKTFEYSTGRHGKEYWTISYADLYENDKQEKKIIPHRNGDCIELRVCWKIETKAIWNLYVDIVTEELILNEQTVVF